MALVFAGIIILAWLAGLWAGLTWPR